MNQMNRYRFHTILLIVTICAAINSVMLEIAGGYTLLNLSYVTLVWIHIAVTTLFLAGIVYHISLYPAFIRNRKRTSRKQRVTKILFVLFLLTTLTGFVSMFLFMTGHDHNPFGGIHGKVGLVALVAALLHIRKRFRRRQTANRKQNTIRKHQSEGSVCREV
ncbi:MAG: hypothetical protein ACRCX4_09055 [Bacteroidales bacterium]